AADNMNDDDSVDLKHKFTLSFNKIEQQKKWILQPGKCVKDAIYAFGIKCTTEHFVIDPSDASYANCNVFTPKEMEEISDTNSKVHPQLPDELRHCINSFNKNNLLDIHRAVMAKQPWEMNYNKTTDSGFDWIKNTMYNLLRLYESHRLKSSHLEQWYNIQCFQN
ncbi:hypothetical protein DFQ28_006306, partial [Apophysomyces sp. BC1034]